MNGEHDRSIHHMQVLDAVNCVRVVTGNQGIGAKEICRLLNWVIAIVWTGMKKQARFEFC
jgi:hypothetical protein